MGKKQSPPSPTHEEGKFTKGDWKASKVMNFSGTLVAFIESGDKEVAQLRGCTTGEEEEAEANAALISCAPEMLDIIKAAKVIFENENNYPDGTAGYQIAKQAKAILSRINKK